MIADQDPGNSDGRMSRSYDDVAWVLHKHGVRYVHVDRG